MNIPKELLSEAVRVSEAPTQTMAVVMGLQELIRKKKMDRLIRMKGSDALGLLPKDLKGMRRR